MTNSGTFLCETVSSASCTARANVFTGSQMIFCFNDPDHLCKNEKKKRKELKNNTVHCTG